MNEQISRSNPGAELTLLTLVPFLLKHQNSFCAENQNCVKASAKAAKARLDTKTMQQIELIKSNLYNATSQNHNSVPKAWISFPFAVNTSLYSLKTSSLPLLRSARIF